MLTRQLRGLPRVWNYVYIPLGLSLPWVISYHFVSISTTNPPAGVAAPPASLRVLDAAKQGSAVDGYTLAGGAAAGATLGEQCVQLSVVVGMFGGKGS